MKAEHAIVQEVNGQKSLYVSPGHLIEIKNVKNDAVDDVKTRTDRLLSRFKWGTF